MKAAVLNKLGTLPEHAHFSDPVVESDEHIIITMKASSIKQLDLLKASGKHYTTYASLPTTVGVDGVGISEDGQRVYAMGVTGMIAEQAIVFKDRVIKVPDGISDELASALPNALIGSDAALIYRAKIKQNDVVLVNGATGVTGMVAVQAAKFHGANKVIVTGRNKATLERLKELGADEIVSLEQDDNTIVNRLLDIHHHTPIDVVMDYLWGHPIELILTVFKQAKILHPTKIITVGEMAGATISLESGILRSKNIELIGSGLGSLSPRDMGDYMKNNLPAMFQLAAEGKLKLDIEIVELKDITQAWAKATKSGKRIVVKI